MEYVLVTGCNGYIGSHTVKALALAGYGVVGVDTGCRDPHPGIAKYLSRYVPDGYYSPSPYWTGSLTMVHGRGHPYRKVIHTAATSLVGPSIANPAEYYQNNVSGMVTFLQAMRNVGVEQIVFSSSAAVYGKLHTVYSEAATPAPISPYGRSKLMGEQILEDYANAYGLRAVALRYFNVCGADPDGELGQNINATHIIPSALRRAFAGQPIIINGNNLPTPDGTAERDYIHVTDVAAANVLAMAPQPTPFRAMNIGSNVGYSNLQIVKAINTHTPLKLDVEFGEARPGDPATLISNNKRAIAELGWKPIYSDLPTIIKTAYNWHKT